MARQARDCNSCAEWESDLVGNIVKTDGFFVPNPTKGIPAAKEARPESVMRLGPTCEIQENRNCPRQPGTPLEASC